MTGILSAAKKRALPGPGLSLFKYFPRQIEAFECYDALVASTPALLDDDDVGSRAKVFSQETASGGTPLGLAVLALEPGTRGCVAVELASRLAVHCCRHEAVRCRDPVIVLAGVHCSAPTPAPLL